MIVIIYNFLWIVYDVTANQSIAYIVHCPFGRVTIMSVVILKRTLSNLSLKRQQYNLSNAVLLPKEELNIFSLNKGRVKDVFTQYKPLLLFEKLCCETKHCVIKITKYIIKVFS